MVVAKLLSFVIRSHAQFIQHLRIGGTNCATEMEQFLANYKVVRLAMLHAHEEEGKMIPMKLGSCK